MAKTNCLFCKAELSANHIKVCACGGELHVRATESECACCGKKFPVSETKEPKKLPVVEPREIPSIIPT